MWLSTVRNILSYGLAWLIIILVVIMIAINILFLIPFKIREAILNYWDQQRIDKVKLISEVEQKYMFFDYKRFFNSTIE